MYISSIQKTRQKPEQIWLNFSYNMKTTIKWGSYPQRGCSWKLIKRNIADLGPPHFIGDICAGITLYRRIWMYQLNLCLRWSSAISAHLAFFGWIFSDLPGSHRARFGCGQKSFCLLLLQQVDQPKYQAQFKDSAKIYVYIIYIYVYMMRIWW